MSERLNTSPIFLTEGGTMGALMRSYDWSTSPLGYPSAWPQPLHPPFG
jgi:hypothetical protein